MKSFASSSPSAAPLPAGQLVDRAGHRFYRISAAGQLPPFFMNVVSASDWWLFLASNGGLTAGRVDHENALFPYVTVDRVYDSTGSTGPVTALWIERPGAAPVCWEPFAAHTARLHDVHRAVEKSVEGDEVWFEEALPAAGLTFRSGWSTADEFGLIRRCELRNDSGAPVRVRVLDGLRNLLPPGVGHRLQSGSSCLVDAYKLAERVPGTTLATYALTAGIIDRAIPLESLRATAVWSEGLPAPAILLTEAQLPRFLAGHAVADEPRRQGCRGAYLAAATLELAAGATHAWFLAVDLGLSAADVVARRAALQRGPQDAAVRAAAAAARRRLRRLVAAADGLQHGGDEVVSAHHFANVLFNVMRGGVFLHGSDVPAADFTAVVHRRNRAVAERHRAWLAALPPLVPRAALLERAAATGDRQLARLALEYLPLTFSRRHGDPSRPWNRFRIRVRDERGEPILGHEGNWRDIFQNWEALGRSFPGFLDAFIAKFLGASTADGYNPYRITHAGIEWEVPDHDDPWASIGYWGDHQVIYLLKLLEWSARHHPGRVAAWLREERFAYAHVPYRITDYAAMRRNPRDTIAFDAGLHRALEQAAAQAGTDARLLGGEAGDPRLANLTEKLLVLLLTRLANFIPGGGIWMNTQRPEWNDANNALVGNGVSMVTLCYLRRFLAHAHDELVPALGAARVPVAAPVAAFARAVAGVLAVHRPGLSAPDWSDTDRRAVVDALSGAGSAYRDTVYRDGLGAPVELAPAELAGLLADALAFVDHTIRANRRPDGLYHAYNLLEFREDPPALAVQHLTVMLEGQVAVLSAGLLDARETIDLLRALRASPLYRPDQHSYLLYPDRRLPGFLEKNHLPAGAAEACPLLRALLDAGDARLVVRDADGACHFHPDLVNGDALEERLAALAAEPRWQPLVADRAAAVRALYETVFHHRAFTGRSGSMFAYEGLGSIYWHMVAKLLLAAQENCLAAAAPAERAELAALYHDIRDGLGFNKTPAEYGAFPTDPYSHTPGHAGAQQPGMTGQVKEEILTRLGELGVEVVDGRLSFTPVLLRAAEFTPAPAVFRGCSDDGAEWSVDVPAGALAFTCCGVPVLYRRSAGPAAIRWTTRDGLAHHAPGTQLDAATSAAVFGRTGAVTRIEVELGGAYQPLPDRT